MTGEIILGLIIGSLIYCLIRIGSLIYCLIRNDWVYRVRIRMIDTDYELYKKMPSYDYMMHRFWVWDVNKFMPREYINA